MNHWPFVIASYVIVGIGTFALLWHSVAAMVNAEKRAEELKRR